MFELFYYLFTDFIRIKTKFYTKIKFEKQDDLTDNLTDQIKTSSNDHTTTIFINNFYCLYLIFKYLSKQEVKK